MTPAINSPIRAARKAKGLRLIDVAKDVRVAVSYVSMIENGYVPGGDVRRRIAAALETDAESLWPGAGA